MPEVVINYGSSTDLAFQRANRQGRHSYYRELLDALLGAPAGSDSVQVHLPPRGVKEDWSPDAFKTRVRNALSYWKTQNEQYKPIVVRMTNSGDVWFMLKSQADQDTDTSAP